MAKGNNGDVLELEMWKILIHDFFLVSHLVFAPPCMCTDGILAREKIS